MIQVLIADDHLIVREGLKQVLASAGGITVAGEAADGHEVMEHVRQGGWDVLVLDMNMPGPSGIDLIKRIKAHKPDAKVLVLSMHGEDQFALRTLRAGASGYLTKGSAPDVIASAIRRVAAGGRHISPALAETLAFELDPFRDKAPHELLSEREAQVLRMLASGKSIADIATQFSLSANTISTHKHRLMRKLGVSNNAELLRYALQADLVE
jgi:two-component system invasion response regulator UvrY